MTHMWYFSRTILFLGIFLIPFLASAQISITEIMYDLEGSDSGREWVEVKNEGSEPVDFTFCKFFENDTNHAIKEHQGGTVIPPSGFAVIADNAGQFLADQLGFWGIVFDSAFSLSNIGELLAIRDSALAEMDTVTYQSAWGAVGDGTSLQKVDGEWKSGMPTPGAPNSASGSSSSTSGTEGAESSSGTTEASGNSGNNSSGSPSNTSGTGTNNADSQEEKRITARIISPQNVVTGADALFQGEASGFIGEPLPNARFIWNFGDGAATEGKSVLHVYNFPGEYTVFLSASSGEFSATARARVVVETARITISAVAAGEGGFIELKNEGTQDLDLSRWQLGVGERFFPFSSGTSLASHKSVKFGNTLTGLVVQNGAPVRLYYPNAKVATIYDGTGQVNTEAESPVIIPSPVQFQKTQADTASLSSSDTGESSPVEKAPNDKAKSGASYKTASVPLKETPGDKNSEEKVANSIIDNGTIRNETGIRDQAAASAYTGGWVPTAIGGGNFVWWLALATVVSAGIIAAFLAKWRQPADEQLSENSQDETDEYEIEEIEEEEKD